MIVDEWVWEYIEPFHGTFNVTDACRAVGWKATLSPRSNMTQILNALVDDGRLQELIEDHKIVYKVLREGDEHETA